MSKYKLKQVKYIALYEATGFLILLIINALMPKVDYAHHILIESLVIMLIGTLTIYASCLAVKRIIYLEEFIRVCAWCNKIHENGEWIVPEDFAKSHRKSTHGICRECASTFKKDLGSC